MRVWIIKNVCLRQFTHYNIRVVKRWQIVFQCLQFIVLRYKHYTATEAIYSDNITIINYNFENKAIKVGSICISIIWCHTKVLILLKTVYNFNTIWIFLHLATTVGLSLYFYHCNVMFHFKSTTHMHIIIVLYLSYKRNT